MAYGLQIFDSSGNLTLDTSDNTMKDIGNYVVSSVTVNGDITGVTTLTDNSISLVTNNLGDGDVVDVPIVELDPINSKIKVYNGDTGFNAAIRIMEF